MTERKILVSAYGCEPRKGSEQGVGWRWCLQLARFTNIVVITRSNNRDAIEAYLPEQLAARIRFEYYDLPSVVRRFKRRERGLYFYYLLWQWGAYLLARRLMKQYDFDYCMHLTFGSIWMPTFMHLLPLPFIWGPVGGGEAVPFRLIRTLSLKGRFVQYLRYVLIYSMSLNPLIMHVASRTRIILARTGDTARLFSSRHRDKVRVILETAMADEVVSLPIASLGANAKDAIRVIFTGRLVAVKNLPLALQAVARVAGRGIKIDFLILGDGPLRKALEELSRKLGLGHRVTFRGAVTQAEVFEALCLSDIYMFPSLKEGGVWSLMEAMSLGLPAICVKTSGMEIITDDTSAIRIEPAANHRMIEDFAQALERLARSRSLRRQLGDNARRRIEEKFMWKHKGDFLQKLFEEMENGAL